MLQKLFFLLIPLLAFSPANNLIDWDASRKLTWTDFTGKPDPLSTNAALTSSGITIEFGMDKDGLTHTISCRFDKNKSWVRIKNDYILNHEQGHFDIAEIHARLLHKELSAYTFNRKSFNDDIRDIYNGVMKLHVAAQRNYDLETNHSLDSTQQRLWDAKIHSMLKEYEKYSDYGTLKKPV